MSRLRRKSVGDCVTTAPPTLPDMRTTHRRFTKQPERDRTTSTASTEPDGATCVGQWVELDEHPRGLGQGEVGTTRGRTGSRHRCEQPSTPPSSSR